MTSYTEGHLHDIISIKAVIYWSTGGVQDLSNPMAVMFEMSSEDVEEERTFEVTEAIPDVELFDFPTSTRSIHVISGA